MEAVDCRGSAGGGFEEGGGPRAGRVGGRGCGCFGGGDQAVSAGSVDSGLRVSV